MHLRRKRSYTKRACTLLQVPESCRIVPSRAVPGHTASAVTAEAQEVRTATVSTEFVSVSENNTSDILYFITQNVIRRWYLRVQIDPEAVALT